MAAHLIAAFWVGGMLSSAILLAVCYYLRRVRKGMDFTVQQHARPANRHDLGGDLPSAEAEPLPRPERLPPPDTGLEGSGSAAERSERAEEEIQMASTSQYV